MGMVFRRLALPAIAVGNLVIATVMVLNGSRPPFTPFLLADFLPRNHRGTIAYLISCSKPIFFRILVQLLQCDQPRRPCNVLVRNSGKFTNSILVAYLTGSIDIHRV